MSVLTSLWSAFLWLPRQYGGYIQKRLDANKVLREQQARWKKRKRRCFRQYDHDMRLKYQKEAIEKKYRDDPHAFDSGITKAFNSFQNVGKGFAKYGHDLP